MSDYNAEQALGEIERLRQRVVELEAQVSENVALRQHLAEMEAAANDQYMPTVEEWRAYPWAVAAATDRDGKLWLYGDGAMKPVAAEIWYHTGKSSLFLRMVAPPVSFRTTLRRRPEGV